MPDHVIDLSTAADPTAPIWTPKLVEEALVEAARWVVTAAGQTGPGPVRGFNPEVLMSVEERIAEGWESVPADDGRRRRLYSPAQVSWMEAALYWPTRYLADPHPGPARVLKIWLRCKAYRVPFDKAVAHRRWSRATAYRARDRALSIIAAGLTRDRVPTRGVTR